MKPLCDDILNFDEIAQRRIAQLDAKAQNEQLERQKKQAKEREEQITIGRCTIKPLPNVATQPFRSELSVEHNSIFVSNSFKGDSFERTWEAKHPESGEVVLRRLLVGKVNETDRSRGVLKQSHQDAFYRLLDVWAKQGYQLLPGKDGNVYGQISATAYEIVTAICADDSEKEYQRAQQLLQDMASVPIVLENSYTWQGLVDRDQFTLLGEVRWKERSVDKVTRRPKPQGSSQVVILFSSRMTEGFLNKHIKMLLGAPYWSLGSAGHGRRAEVARLLYPFLDGQLATKDEYNICLCDLFSRFALAKYAYRSKRREKILPTLKMLDGKPIVAEKYVLNVSLRNSSDGEDYILVARRELPSQLQLWTNERSPSTTQ